METHTTGGEVGRTLSGSGRNQSAKGDNDGFHLDDAAVKKRPVFCKGVALLA
jgi:hypothetical protein